MINNLEEIINNSISVEKKLLNRDLLTNILKDIRKSFKNNKDAIILTNNIDIKNNNGFKIDNNIFDNIFKLLDRDYLCYKDTIISKKDDDIIYGEEIYDSGTSVIINDGNSYVILELILKNLLAGNSIIVTNSGYMYGLNNFMVELIRKELENNKINPNMLQMYIDDNYMNILKRYANIDIIEVVGDNNLQMNVLKESNNRVIVSGYDNYDIYIEDDTNMDFVNKIVNSTNNINVYALSNVKIKGDKVNIVMDIDEAIARINYESSHYSSSIFTNNPNKASKFIKEVKSKLVTVNTSPSIEKVLDIDVSDLIIRKKIIYPFNIKVEERNNN